MRSIYAFFGVPWRTSYNDIRKIILISLNVNTDGCFDGLAALSLWGLALVVAPMHTQYIASSPGSFWGREKILGTRLTQYSIAV